MIFSTSTTTTTTTKTQVNQKTFRWSNDKGMQILIFTCITSIYSPPAHAVFTRDTFTRRKLTFLSYCVTFSIVKWHLPHVNVSPVNTALAGWLPVFCRSSLVPGPSSSLTLTQPLEPLGPSIRLSHLQSPLHLPSPTRSNLAAHKADTLKVYKTFPGLS